MNEQGQSTAPRTIPDIAATAPAEIRDPKARPLAEAGLGRTAPADIPAAGRSGFAIDCQGMDRERYERLRSRLTPTQRAMILAHLTRIGL